MRAARHGQCLLCLTGILGALLILAAPGGSAAAAASFTPPPCSELLQNGGFEGPAGWTINQSATPAVIVNEPVHTGQHAMRLGIAAAANRASYSSIQQQVHLPAGASHITLRFHAYTVSETSFADEQLLALLDPASGSVLATPWRSRAAGRAWKEEVVELTAYRGRTVLLYFNVRNDAAGGRTAMYLDDVSLQACPAATPGATSWPTPAPSRTSTTIVDPRTPTPITSPSGPCQVACLPNGDFEAFGQWQLGATSLQPAYVSGRGPDGSMAMMLGNDGQRNVAAYSSIRQDVSVPSWASSVRLRFWFWPIAEPPSTGDRQELLLLRPDSERVEAVLWREHRHDRQWLEAAVDLTQHRGRTMSIYFNVYNDGRGGRAALYLDQVCWELCGVAPPTPTLKRPSSTPTQLATGTTRTPTVARPSSTVTRFRSYHTPTATVRATGTPSASTTRTATAAMVPEALAQLTPTLRSSPAPSPARLPLTGDWQPMHWLLMALAALLLVAALAALAIVLLRR